jgi:hypothetical protein
VGWYQVNKEYIAANLCINRDKPELNCCGKCYLKKQFSKSEQSQERKGNIAKSENVFTVFIIPQCWQADTYHIIANKQRYGTYSMAIITSLPSDIFHPPPYIAYSSQA